MTITKSDLKVALKSQEQKIDQKFKKQDKRIDQKLENLRRAINRDLADVIDKRILPQIDSLSDGIERVNRQLNAALDRADRHSKKLEDHEQRIGQLETTSPAVL